MTRGNFDPDNPDRDPGTRGGPDRFLGPPAREGSAIPSDVTDGTTDAEEDAPEDVESSHEAKKSDDVAKALEPLTEEHPGEPGLTSRHGL